MTKPAQPVNVSFYSHMGIEAARRPHDDTAGIGQAFRLWVYAKALDVQGLGMVRRRDLRSYLLSLGATPRMWQRWMNQARAHGFVMDIQKGRDWWLILPRAGKVALEAGWAANLGKKITIPARELIGPGWKARMFTAWEHNKQISREQIQKKFNVSLRTQTYRAGQMGEGYTRKSNYSRSALKADKFQMVKEYSSHKAPFISGNGFIYWRLPDLRHSASVQRVSKGRARKENLYIRQHTENQKGLSYTRRALADDFQPGEYLRLFNLTDDQLKQSERKIARQDRRINDLYLYASEAQSGAGIWAHCPQI